MASKTRTYTGVYYPENKDIASLLSYLKNKMLPAIISPIHSADNNEKKDHVHFMVDYPNPVRLETARSDYGSVAANGYLEPVRSRKVMMRYFVHLDDEDKEQLDPADVVTICGAIYDITPDLSADDIMRIIIEIQNFIEDNHITEYSDICRIVSVSEKYDWFRVLYTHTIHFGKYLASKRYKEQGNEITRH